MVVGATATGKTRVAVQMAREVGGEVVSLDSRQVYRGMDIGTAKPTAAERRGVAHHLIDIVNPDETVALAEMLDRIVAAVEDIRGRGRQPILAGGTGQYVRALREGWVVPRVPPDDELRAALASHAQAEGAESLHARLAGLDPAAAQVIEPANTRRVIRALEVCLKTGQPFSEARRRTGPRYPYRIVGLTRAWDDLDERIGRRVDAMMATGLRGEVEALLRSGYGFDLPSMSGLGYREWPPHFQGHASVDDVAAAIRTHTRQFARSQAGWFRLGDAEIHWLKAHALDEGAARSAARRLVSAAPGQ